MSTKDSKSYGSGELKPPETVIPPQWPGYELGLGPPKVTRLGSAKISPYGPDKDVGFSLPEETRPPSAIKSPTERSPCCRTSAFRFVDFKTRTQYRITIDHEDLAHLRSRLPRQPGALKPQTVSEIQKLALIQPGDPLPAVFGEDTRIRIEPTTVFPYSAIVHLSNVLCSGALITDYVVLTAAHCVVNGGQAQDPGYEEIWYDFNVIPGMDRDPSCNSGDESESCRIMPFGEIGVDSVMVPEGWLEPKGSVPEDSIVPFIPDWWVDDIAVVFLEEPVGQQTGTFDYRALKAWQLENGAFMNRGYPSHVNALTPPGFEAWQMWGDQNYCLVEGFLGEVDGIHRLFTHHCDTSGGHSGSPIYQWHVSLDQGWRPQIVGLVSSSSAARRITESDVNGILDFGVTLGLAKLAG